MSNGYLILTGLNHICIFIYMQIFVYMCIYIYIYIYIYVCVCVCVCVCINLVMFLECVILNTWRGSSVYVFKKRKISPSTIYITVYFMGITFILKTQLFSIFYFTDISHIVKSFFSVLHCFDKTC